MEKQTVKIGPGGRIVIPADIRARLSLKIGDSLTLMEADGEIRLSTIEPKNGSWNVKDPFVLSKVEA